MYDSSISLKDRSFVIFSFVLIVELIFVAIPLGFLMREPLSSALSTFAGAAVFALYVGSAIRRKKIAVAKTVVSILLLLVYLPLMFFTNGGIYSGIPVSMLLGGIYINMILEGRLQIFMNVIYSVVMIACWVISYYLPGLVTEYSRKVAFIDTLSSLLIVNLVIYVLLTFHTRLYERENEIARKNSEKLEEMNRAQNRFFSSMSHEIRTPINTIMGMDEMILREDAKDVPKNYFLSVVNYAIDIRTATESLLN